MKRLLRRTALPALVVAAGMFAFAPPAKAGVGFGFYGPGVSVSIGVPGPFYPGYVVPAPRAVIYRPYYGYGFWAPAGYGYAAPYWVPVHTYHSHWVVSPYGRYARGYGYGHGYGRGYGHGYGHGHGW
ncbi:MAG TPA: hypothetical protein VFA98_11050 [Thermoanaerobaculia bacterium]|nr:hypothetical protein [Thermoanaerobaculia bacterium]